jgi:hypothetical protein
MLRTPVGDDDYWRSQLDDFRAGKHPTRFQLMPLLEVLATLPQVRKFSFFTSHDWLRFSGCPDYPYSTWELPTVLGPIENRQTFGIADAWDDPTFFEGSLQQAAARLIELLEPRAGEAFSGSSSTRVLELLDDEWSRRGLAPICWNREPRASVETLLRHGSRGCVVGSLWNEQYAYLTLLEDSFERSKGELPITQAAEVVNTWLTGGALEPLLVHFGAGYDSNPHLGLCR